MSGMNIVTLRKRNNLTQEELAEKLAVSRQTLAKWEQEISKPDIESLQRISEMFHVSLDDLVNYNEDKNLGFGIPKKGKHFFGSVTVGERGQIVIPQKARKIFNINPGDQLLILGDEDRGLAIMPKDSLMELMNLVIENQDNDVK